MTRKLAEKRAEEIVKENIESWGEGRSRYQIEIVDLRVLLKAGAMRVCIDHNNGDGTYFSEVSYDGRFFACSSTKQVEK